MTNEEFKKQSIEKAQKDIDKNQYPCKINHISEVYLMKCEWCSKKTKAIHISTTKLNKKTPDFTRGSPNNGQYSFFEDSKFGAQCEWFVCNSKECLEYTENYK